MKNEKEKLEKLKLQIAAEREANYGQIIWRRIMMLIDTSIIIDFIGGEKKIVSLIQELAEKKEVKNTSINRVRIAKTWDTAEETNSGRVSRGNSGLPLRWRRCQRSCRTF
jgi:hypothetical protein